MYTFTNICRWGLKQLVLDPPKFEKKHREISIGVPYDGVGLFLEDLASFSCMLTRFRRIIWIATAAMSIKNSYPNNMIGTVVFDVASFVLSDRLVLALNDLE